MQTINPVLEAYIFDCLNAVYGRSVRKTCCKLESIFQK